MPFAIPNNLHHFSFLNPSLCVVLLSQTHLQLHSLTNTKPRAALINRYSIQTSTDPNEDDLAWADAERQVREARLAGSAVVSVKSQKKTDKKRKAEAEDEDGDGAEAAGGGSTNANGLNGDREGKKDKKKIKKARDSDGNRDRGRDKAKSKNVKKDSKPKKER